MSFRLRRKRTCRRFALAHTAELYRIDLKHVTALLRQPEMMLDRHLLLAEQVELNVHDRLS